MKHAMPLMVARGGGSIINTASIAGLQAGFGPLAYSAAKCAVIHMSRCAAAELSPQKIRVNAICPGYVKTPLVEAQIADQARTRGISEDAVMRDVILAAQPTKQFVTVEQLAGLALYLCSDAGASVNGAILPVDGGWTAR